MRKLIVVLLFLRFCLPCAADSFVRFEENGKVGLRNEQGHIVIPASFEALGWSDGNFSILGQVTGYKINGRWGIINLQKQFLTPADFESLTSSGGDRIVASRQINPFTIKFGCVDLGGKVTVPFRYDGIQITGLRAVVFVKNGATFEYGLIDLDDHGIIPLRYRQLYPIGTLRYAVENDSSRTALFSEQGVPLTGFVIDSISSFHHGMAVFYQHFAQGIIDREGEVKLPATYREIRIEGDGSLLVRDFDEWKILDAENHELRKIVADQLDHLEGGLYRVTLAGKTGLVDGDFHPSLTPSYDYVGREDHGHRVVAVRGQYRVIRKNNESLLPAGFDTLTLEQNFIRAGKRSHGKMFWTLYDTFGIEKTTSHYEFLGAYNGSFFPVMKRGYWGAVNRYGEEFLDCVFDSLIDFRDDLVLVRFHHQYGVVDQHEKWLLAPQDLRVALATRYLYLEAADGNNFLKNYNGETIYFTPHRLVADGDHLTEFLEDGTTRHISFQGALIPGEALPDFLQADKTFPVREGMRGIQKDGKFGFVDARGRLRIANRYDSIGAFQEGLAPIKLIGKWGYISMTDQIIINPNYDVVQPFVKGKAIVRRNGKSGLIDQTGNAVLPLRYDSVALLPDRTYLLKDNHLFGLSDQQGNVLIEPRFDYLQNLQNGYVVAGREEKFGVLTQQGLSTIPMMYDRLLFDSSKNQFLAWRHKEWKKENRPEIR